MLNNLYVIDVFFSGMDPRLMQHILLIGGLFFIGNFFQFLVVEQGFPSEIYLRGRMSVLTHILGDIWDNSRG